MAGRVPFFLTGANARILLNNRTVAFATNVSYKISVKHATPRVLGRFEVETVQPMAYDVAGSMTFLRYARGLRGQMSGPDGVADEGNSLGSFGPDGLAGIVQGTLGLPSATGQFDGGADESLNPSRFFQAKQFDVEIRQLLPQDHADDGAIGDAGKAILQGAANALGLGGGGQIAPLSTKANETTVVLIRNCRIEDYSFSLSKRGVATVTLMFRGQYVDDDTALARKSGVGQELT